jgi:uncharacterized protein involved in exopolysaccharide biosynthesis
VVAARAHELSIQRDLERLEAQFGAAGQAGVQLRQLERDADANRALYEAYLSRYKETSAQQELQHPDAFLITRARVPLVPTHPRRMPVLMLGLIFGSLSGLGMAMLLDRMDD